jgi:hypothetical protein
MSHHYKSYRIITVYNVDIIVIHLKGSKYTVEPTFWGNHMQYPSLDGHATS